MTYTGPGEFLTITGDNNPDTVRRHEARYIRAIRLAGKIGTRWLDCACGTGYGVKLIAQHVGEDPDIPNMDIWGVDGNLDAIDYARSNYAALYYGVFRNLDIKHASEWLDWMRPFDVILSLETLEHLTPDVQESWVKAAAAGLANDGVFVIACPIGNDGPSSYNRYHLHEPSLDGLNALLSGHFKSVEIETEEYVDTGGRDAIQAFAVCR